jgi:hypothetical protein
MRKIVILLVLFVSATCFAQVEDNTDSGTETFANRASSIAAKAASGSNDYRGLTLKGRAGLNPDWQLKMDLSRSTSSGSESRAGNLGLSVNISPEVELHLQGQGQEIPTELTGRGILAGSEIYMSEFWQGELETSLSVDFEFNRFTQGTVADATLLTNDFDQSALHLDFAQQISAPLTLSLHASKYRYKDQSTNVITSVTSRRSRRQTVTTTTTISSSQIASGFTDRTVGIGVDWTISRIWSASLSLDQSTAIFTNEKTRSQTITLDYSFMNHWLATAGYSHAKPESDQDSHTGELGIKYTF